MAETRTKGKPPATKKKRTGTKRQSTTKRTTKPRTKRPDTASQFVKILSSLTLLILLVVCAGVMAYYFLQQPSRPAITMAPPEVRLPVPPPVKAPVKAPPPKTPAKPTYEVYPQKELPAKPLDKIKPQSPQGLPLVAIVLDDVGYDRQMGERFLSIDAPLTFSVLPDGPFSCPLARQAQAKGREIMLHLPMEPNEYPEVDPGPGALLSNMTPDELIGQLTRDLEQLPGLKGVNNHMGSRLTASPERMRQIFSILKKRGLYFIDSRTTVETVARPSAKLLNVPFAERDIFLDHLNDPAFIRKQLNKLITRAKEQGYAVAIGHPHENTYRVLKEFMPRLKKSVEIVPASTVVQAVMYAEAQKR